MKTFLVRCRQTAWFDEYVEAEDAAEAQFKAECGYGTDQEYHDYEEVEIVGVEEVETEVKQ